MTTTHLSGPRKPSRALATSGLLTLAVLGLTLVAPCAAVASSVRKLEDIAITPSTVSLIPGATQPFTATALYSDGTTADVTAMVDWQTRDDQVVAIAPGGLAVAIKSGRSDVTATLASARVTSRKAAKVTVAKLDALTIDPVSAGVRIGSSLPVRALGTYDDGTTGVDLTKQVTFSTQKKTIARIDTDATGQIVVVGVAAGITTVQARDPDSGVRSTSSSGTITVVGNLLSVEVSPDSRMVRVGERVKYKALGHFENGITTDISDGVDWSTGDTSIATIDVQGRVTGVKVGSTTVIAADQTSGITSTQSAHDGVAQVIGDLTSLTVKPTPLALALGGKANLKASGTFVNVPKSVNLTTKVEWHSSDPSKVDVSRLGVASCVSAGTVMVSVRDALSGITSTATGGDALVRCGIPVVGVQIAPTTLTMKVGKTKKVKAFLVYGDSSRDDISKRVTWASSAPAVATIDTTGPNPGRLTGLAAGQTTISADDPATGLSSSAPGGADLLLTIR